MTKTSILIIDKDPTLCELLENYLSNDHWDVRSATDGEHGFNEISTHNFDLIILDLMLETINGLVLLKKIRQKTTVPILLFTSKHRINDALMGLELGGTDYFIKPCSPSTLLECVQRYAYSTRQRDHNHDIIDVGKLNINLSQRIVCYADVEIPLTLSEFSVLVTLASQPGVAFSKQSLSEKALNRTHTVHDRNVDVHISRLRQKIGSSSEKLIKTVRGYGYMLSKD